MNNAEPKKRGRKPKKEELPQPPLLDTEPIQLHLSEPEPEQEPEPVPPSQNSSESQLEIADDAVALDEFVPEKIGAKKRGRKPKGGKIIQQAAPVTNNNENKPNVILHLKCFLRDLQNNTLLQNVVDNYAFSSNKSELAYEVISSNQHPYHDNSCHTQVKKESFSLLKHDEDSEEDSHSNLKDVDTREVWKKLKALEHNLHMNNIADKKSACFWCTCDFDNPPVYIPKHHIKDSYNVYGCFCSPECAVAHLMDENIDSSAKFERYYLINHIYAKIYDYQKNIKPAPNPYYMLDKFYGNLSIQEYRLLLRNERLFLVVDKPLTRILPELHEDNDDFIINNKIIPSNTYQIKKKLQRKQQSKTNIINESFGVSAAPCM